MANAEPDTFRDYVAPRPRVHLFAAFGLSALAISIVVAVLSYSLVLDAVVASGAVAVFAVAMALVAIPLARDYPHTHLGGCNVITQLRAGLVCALASVIIVPDAMVVAPVPIFVVAVITLSLDGIDGWLARRSGLSSAFGARFDMEVDSALGAVLALIILSAGKAGPEILILGFARYAFLAASAMIPRLSAPLPESLRRKTICVLQISALCALLLPFILPPVSTVIAFAASFALIFSFARDVIWLMRR